MELLPRREMRSLKTRQPKDMIATLTPLICCSRWQPKAESTNAVILRSRTDKVQAASNHRYQPKTACGNTWLAKELEWGHTKSQHAQTTAKESPTYCQKPHLQPGRASRMRETTLEMAAAFRLGMSSGLHLVDKYSFSTGSVLACSCSSTSAQVWMAATSINCVGSPSWMKEQRVFKCDCPFGVSCKELSADGFLAGVSGCCFKDSRSFWISSTNLSSFWRVAASRFFFLFLGMRRGGWGRSWRRRCRALLLFLLSSSPFVSYCGSMWQRSFVRSAAATALSVVMVVLPAALTTAITTGGFVTHCHFKPHNLRARTEVRPFCCTTIGWLPVASATISASQGTT